MGIGNRDADMPTFRTPLQEFVQEETWIPLVLENVRGPHKIEFHWAAVRIEVGMHDL
jgi:hypothetical protein